VNLLKTGNNFRLIIIDYPGGCVFLLFLFSMNRKVSVARLSVFSNTLLIILKVVVGILSGSISILSEAIHSFMDLLAAIIAYFSVKISDAPADERHPYGHGKFENISGVIEAMLMHGSSLKP
jgi:cation diffusion facilitator family transporter